jgi:hypothetical protein
VLVDATYIYVAATYDGVIYKVNKSSGLIYLVGGKYGDAWNPPTPAEGVPAIGNKVGQPRGMVMVGTDLYFADELGGQVKRIDASGNLWTVAGLPYQSGYTGDGGQATAAKLFGGYTSVGNGVQGLAAWNNKLYISDTYNHVIRQVDLSSGVITTAVGFAGGGAGYSGDLGPATAARLSAPRGLAISGNTLVIADSGNSLVRGVDLLSNIIFTLAGNSTSGNSGDNGPAGAAQLASPCGVAVDLCGNVLVSDSVNGNVRMISSGVITSLAGGNPPAGTPTPGAGDNGSAAGVTLSTPQFMAVDPGLGDLYVVERGYGVRKITRCLPLLTATHTFTASPTFTATNYAGSATHTPTITPSPTVTQTFTKTWTPVAGCLSLTASTVDDWAGGGSGGTTFPYGDGGSATATDLFQCQGVCAAPDGSIYVTETFGQVVRKIDVDRVIWTVAGVKNHNPVLPNYVGDPSINGGVTSPATNGFLINPYAPRLDAAGNLYFTDSQLHVVIKVDTGGNGTIIAGTAGVAGYTGDSGPANAWNGCLLNRPMGLAVDNANPPNLYVADTVNQVIRKIDSSGVITTIIGDGSGVAGFSGDSGPAVSAKLSLRDPVPA